jgi:hypothetical protein
MVNSFLLNMSDWTQATRWSQFFYCFYVLVCQVEYLRLGKNVLFFEVSIFKKQIWIVLVSLSVLGSFIGLLYPNLGVIVVGLFFLQILQTVALKGFFMGGADQMGLLVGLCLTVGSAEFLSEKFGKAAVLYLGIQLTGSYFVAGISRALNKNAWTGEFFLKLIETQNYQIPPGVREIFRKKLGLARICSVGIIIFEIAFPFVVFFLGGSFLVTFLFLGLVFHGFNAWVLGLNRFFWAWLSAYPSLIYLSHHRAWSLWN